MTTFINHYICPDCATEWYDTWDCACNDHCPDCDKEIEPVDSVEYEVAEVSK